MWIFFRVAVSVVHAVHDGIRTGVKKGRSLGKNGKPIEKTLPELIHGEHFMRSIPVQKKRLAKERQEPMSEEKNENSHKSQNLV